MLMRLLYHISQIFATLKGALPSSFRHLFITSTNHFIAFSCHSDFGCIVNPLSLARNFILLFGASANAWCYALRSQNANHRGAICARSLSSKLVASLRLIIIKYFDTRYFRSWSVANSLPFAICHLIVLSE